MKSVSVICRSYNKGGFYEQYEFTSVTDAQQKVIELAKKHDVYVAHEIPWIYSSKDKNVTIFMVDSASSLI